MQTRIVVTTANPVTEIGDGQAYARYYLCFYLFPATDYCLKPWLRNCSVPLYQRVHKQFLEQKMKLHKQEIRLFYKELFLYFCNFFRGH